MTESTVFTKSISRKKPVPGKYQPNTYRVISSQAEDFRRHHPSSSRSPLPTNNLGQRLDKTQVNADYRRNRPNPINVGFLYENTHTLNEPVSAVVTEAGRLQRSWWPTCGPDAVPRTPAPHTLDTTARESYQYHGGEGSVRGHRRYSNNPDQLPVLGIVPVNLLRRSDGKQRFWKEGFSMEQHVDCRRTPSYPNSRKATRSLCLEGNTADES
ncbi:hypothetical protein LSAT2_031976 [Lamellibrachia satsuma]|nr:hypothetical protein LSAT2_031976 [Lamellibrachia satsuma]